MSRPPVGYVASRAHALMRRMIRIGEVIELAPADGMVRVRFEDTEDGTESPWLPWASASFGGGSGDTTSWVPPNMGARVVVFSPYGDVEAGFVWGSLMKDASGAPASDDERVFKVGPLTITMNVSSGALDISTSGKVTITGEGIALDAGATKTADISGFKVRLNP